MVVETDWCRSGGSAAQLVNAGTDADAKAENICV